MPHQERLRQPGDAQHEQIRQHAHDARNSLHVIQMGLELLKGCREDEPRFQDVLDMLDRARKEGLTAIDELAAAARQPGGER